MTMFKGRVKEIHFVGIGGIGMSGIAELLLNLGYAVSGSDQKESDTTQRLSKLGGRVTVGHRAENIGQAEVVVISSAVKADNPEVVEAKRRAIPVIPRAEMLGELMRLKHGIAVAGSHGKTTTTSMVATVLDQGGLDPTVVIGGKVNSLGTNARLGTGEYLVAEADESDGSFMRLTPTIVIVTNIDAEHLDHYGSFEALEKTFLHFINEVPFYGLAVLCSDCAVIRKMLPHVERRFVTYGTTSGAHYTLGDLQCEGLKVRGVVSRNHGHKEHIPIEVPMVGKHNLLNAVATLAVADELGIPTATTQVALQRFSGVQRRFTIRGEERKVTVVDDYGHHPTEIRATLAGARAAFPTRRIIALFQPHRYSRLRDLQQEFAGAFPDADLVFVAPVYAAGESPIPGVNAETVAADMKRQGHKGAHVFANADALLGALRETVKADDLVISLGAGDIWKVGQSLLTDLQKAK